MIFTALAPRLIQSISRNVHNKNRALKQVCRGGSPNLVDLVEWKVPIEKKMGGRNTFHSFHPGLYTCAIFTESANWALFCGFSTF